MALRTAPVVGSTLSLLRLGALAGPFYVTVALAQALTREGFDLSRHPWSFLANGELGWIQTANFVITALATIAFAIGLRRTLTPAPSSTSTPGPSAAPASAPGSSSASTSAFAPGSASAPASALTSASVPAPTPAPAPAMPASGRGSDGRPSGRGSRWAPRLIAAFGASMLGAAIFPADPAMGFPTGTPEGPGTITLSGTLHMAVGGVGFLCLVAACYVLASRFSRSGERGWAIYTRITGTLFLGAFLGIATGGAIAWANLIFVTAIIAVWCWMSLLSIKFSRNA
ncbi:DUF998 domain-containing protein [Nonomuraea sp. NPDC050663]|uniref:DUF998 domain-containing protein n=1 Tax=Nonomuraea sp. NPDC050663 TaxID=3364370 RepID=UPI0037A74973